MQPVTAAVSAASLIVGFAVADATGIRPLGGLVLVAGGAWCALAWNRTAGRRVAGALVGVGLVAFVAAHVLALGLGVPAYPAVFAVAAVDAAVVLAVRPSRELAHV